MSFADTLARHKKERKKRDRIRKKRKKLKDLADRRRRGAKKSADEAREANAKSGHRAHEEVLRRRQERADRRAAKQQRDQEKEEAARERQRQKDRDERDMKEKKDAEEAAEEAREDARDPGGQEPKAKGPLKGRLVGSFKRSSITALESYMGNADVLRGQSGNVSFAMGDLASVLANIAATMNESDYRKEQVQGVSDALFLWMLELIAWTELVPEEPPTIEVSAFKASRSWDGEGDQP